MTNVFNLKPMLMTILLTSLPLFAMARDVRKSDPNNYRGGIGTGGSGKVGVGANSLPADFFAELNGPEFPRKNETPISLEKNYPELYAEVQRIFKILRKRNRNTDPWLHKLTEYKIYVVDKLSGASDVVKMKHNLKLIPTAVTYNFSELSPGGRTRREHRVIELSRKTFFNRSLRHQALDIIHEMAHHEKHEPRASDHQFISPFITGLNALLDVIERQKNQDYSLSDSEYEKIVTMQNMMENIFGKYGFNKDYEFFVYRNGGGILEVRLSDRTFKQNGTSISEQATELLQSQDKKLRSNGNIIDALSTAQFEISVHKSGYKFYGDHKILDKMPKDSITLDHVKNNKIVNSMIHFGIWDKSCARNTFINIQRQHVFEKNIPVDDVDYKKPRSMLDGVSGDQEWQFKEIFYVDCQGDDNTVKDITSDRILSITGNYNLVEKIGTSISVEMDGNFNTLSNIKLPEFIREKYSIVDEYGGLFNSTQIRVKGSNNQIVNSEPARQIFLDDVSNSRIDQVNNVRIEIFKSKDVYISNFKIEAMSLYGIIGGLNLERKKTMFYKITPSLRIIKSQDVLIENVKVKLGDQTQWISQMTGSIYGNAVALNVEINKTSFHAKNLAIDNSPIRTEGVYEQVSPIGLAIFHAPTSMTDATVRLQDLCTQRSATKEMECRDMKAFTNADINDEKF